MTTPSTQPVTQNQDQNHYQTFTLLLFASASTFCSNTDSLSLPAPTTLFKLFLLLEDRFPGVCQKVLRSSQVVVNLDYVDCEVEEIVRRVLRRVKGVGIGEDKDKGEEEGGDGEGDQVVIKAGDEVAVVPPVSSG